jgi:hypothetical protein
MVSEISGSHGVEYEDDSLLRYCLLPVSSSRLMMEAVRTSEKLVSLYETTRLYIRQGWKLQYMVKIY